MHLTHAETLVLAAVCLGPILLVCFIGLGLACWETWRDIQSSKHQIVGRCAEPGGVRAGEVGRTVF